MAAAKPKMTLCECDSCLQYYILEVHGYYLDEKMMASSKADREASSKQQTKIASANNLAVRLKFAFYFFHRFDSQVLVQESQKLIAINTKKYRRRTS